METNKTITEDYVSFETAKKLKEKGFDVVTEKCYILDNSNLCAVTVGRKPQGKHEISAPTLQMACKWLREVHNCIITFDYDSYENADDSSITETGYSFTLQRKENPTEYEYIHDWVYDTYEEAVEDGIKYCLTLIK